MTTQYTRSVLKMVVAQICQTIGWHSINSTPLEFMVDLMQEYIFQLSKLTQQYAQVLGRSDANLDDLGLAFRHMNIDLHELAEYVKNVDSVPCVLSIPKLPIHRENHLNFLKPGSREVVTRPVHVHEHLPAMHPSSEEEYSTESKQTEAINTSTISEPINTSEDDSNEINNTVTTNGSVTEDSPGKAVSQVVFKRPGDPISFDGPSTKRAKTTEEGRPLREIHSVIMTTSGFLSTAREGKLPEARTPQQTRVESPTPVSYPMVPPEIKVEKKLKKIPKKTSISEDGKPENKENKKKKIPKDILFKPDEIKDVKVKKLTGIKDVAKLKALKSGSKAANTNLAGPSNVANTGKVQGKVPGGSPKHIKNIASVNKIKTEKVDVLPNTGNLVTECKEETIDKLPIEPDKQKLNIFKKISSKPKEDKEKEMQDPQHKSKELGSRENSPCMIVDDNERHRNDVVIKQEDKKPIVQSPLVDNNAVRVPVAEDNVTNVVNTGSDVYMFDVSPPGTPNTSKTPKTPDIPHVSIEQKKKRKEKTGKKKESKPKTPRSNISPKKARLTSDPAEVTVLERPKTPQAPEHLPPRDSNLPPTLPFPFFPPFPAAPGLIPHPMFPLPLHKGMVPGMVPPNPGAVMPNMLRQRFFRPKLDGTRPLVPPSFVGDPLQPPTPMFPLKLPQQQQQQQQPPPPAPLLSPTLEKPRMIKSPEKELLPPKPTGLSFLPPEAMLPPPILNSGAGIPAPLVPQSIPPVVPAPLLSTNVPLTKPLKPEKAEKADKKSKEHKKEKKDKLKKKKEKKEKHKDKVEKIKDKKEKSVQKKEKLEKIKEKKEKKEKRKEKEKEKEASKKVAKEEKVIESVPKITLKLGPAGGSPRPPTPENSALKKITIKPPKKPEDETKREPTPELARISALVTRPPKQKSTSKKAEEGLLEAYATALPSEASFSSATLVPTPRAKKPIFKALPRREPSPLFPIVDSFNSHEMKEDTEFCFTDQSGRKIWICPACGKQDDGSPMIGCDDCDAWYHWVCVGIQVAPAANEDWYCRLCIAKKQEEQYHDKKKKKRKKKVKVNA